MDIAQEVRYPLEDKQFPGHPFFNQDLKFMTTRDTMGRLKFTAFRKCKCGTCS